jgi:hypothetical protein
MNATSSALLKDVVENLEPLQSLNDSFFHSPEFWGSIIASLTALFISIGGARYIKRFFKIKPELAVISFKRYTQNTYYWRIAIRNSGKEVARNVQVDVTSISDNGIKRKNFLSIPLRWTHLNCENRDILPNQIAYIDVIEHKTKPNSKNEVVKIISRCGGGVDDFEILQPGKSRIILTFYEKSGISFSKEIHTSWTGENLLDGKIKGKTWHLTRDGSFI